MYMKIKKGDSVIIIAGKDKGKSGKVLRSYPSDSMVLVEGMNMKKRHQRPTRQNQHGQIVEKSFPVHISNVAIIDPKTNKQARVGYKIENGKKIRIARKSGSILS